MRIVRWRLGNMLKGTNDLKAGQHEQVSLKKEFEG